jgi:tetratricopeptide (TPR) repeat protein
VPGVILALLIGCAALGSGTARAFVSVHSVSSDSGEQLIIREDFLVCIDQKQPLPKRVSTCTMVMEHGSKMSLESDQEASLYVSIAAAFQEIGDDPTALRCLNSAVKADPKYEHAWLARANFYVSKANFADALPDYSAALKINPKDPVAYDNRGIALHVMGKREEAIADFTSAISFDPQDVTAYSNRATLNLAANRLDLVIADLTVVIRAAPANGMALYNRGTAYERSGETDQALEDYRRAVRLLPLFAPASAALGRLLKDKDPGEAVHELSEAIRLDPRSPALKSRAILYLTLGRLDQALQDFDQVIANDGADSVAYLDRGVTNEKLGNLEPAIRDYTRSIELAPSVEVHVNRGNVYLNLQQSEQALADFNAALALAPDNLPALLGRANAEYARKALAESLHDYTQVIERDPKNVAAYFKRGNVHYDLKEFAASFTDYSDALKLDPQQAVVLYNRALAAGRLGRRNDAAEDRRRALLLDPSLANGEGLPLDH